MQCQEGMGLLGHKQTQDQTELKGVGWIWVYVWVCICMLILPTYYSGWYKRSHPS